MTTNLYALIESRVGHENFGKPFYIGIGTEKRPYRHMREARSKSGHRNLRLHEILCSHRALGVIPEVHILGAFATKNEAGEAEKIAIAKYGRIAIDQGGSLCNLACGGQGPDAELMRLPEVRERNRQAQNALGQKYLSERGRSGGVSANHPENNAKRSAASTEANNRNWADPVIRARRIAAMTGKKKRRSEASDQARRENAKKAQSPESNAKKAEASMQRWADPAYKERLAEKKRRAWQDPAKRERMMASRARRDGPGEIPQEVGVVEREAVHDSSQP